MPAKHPSRLLTALSLEKTRRLLGQLSRLKEVMRDRPAIIIAHRPSTVRHVDRIIVLRDGQIIEKGDHESLLAPGSHYAELYNTYFRHQSLEYVEQARMLEEASD